MEEDLQKQKFIRMTTEPVQKLVFKMAVPAIVSMLISAFYNMADTFFVAKISTEATGAIGIVFSYMALIQAISFFFGHGTGNYISRALGGRNREAAEKMAATGFFFAIFCGIAFVILGYLFMDPLLRLLGSTETILGEARKYFSLILLATPVTIGSFVLNNLMRFQGNAKMGMIGIASGAVLNVILDPILIFGMHMGIRGAAVATAFSQTLSFCLLLYLCGRRDGIKIRFRNFHVTFDRIKEITAGGLPSLGRQGLASISAICLNNVAGFYGDSAIAAFSVVNRIVFIAFSIVIGFGQGFQPVCGFNYGAGLYDRVKRAFWFCVKLATLVLLTCAILGFVFARPIVELFRADDKVLVDIAVQAFRYSCIALPVMGWYTMTTMLLQNIRQTLRATIVASARQGIVFIPILYLFNIWLGLDGLKLAQPVSDFISFCIAVPFSLMALGEMKQTVMEERGD